MDPLVTLSDWAYHDEVVPRVTTALLVKFNRILAWLVLWDVQPADPEALVKLVAVKPLPMDALVVTLLVIVTERFGPS